MMQVKIGQKIRQILDTCQVDIASIRDRAAKIHQSLTACENFVVTEARNHYLYIPKHFKLYELVPEVVYNSENHDILWGQLDSRELWTADALREKYGTCIINDWYWGGEFQESGLRLPNTTTGARWSQHKRGAATDKKFPDANIKDIIEDMKNHPDDPAFRHITTVEETHNGETPTWLHTDCRNRKPNGGIVFLQL